MQYVDAYYSNEHLLLSLAALPNLDLGYHIWLRVDEMETDMARLQLTSLNNLVGVRSTTLRNRYRQMLVNFLGDPERSGCYFLDSAKYARASMCALKRLLSRQPVDLYTNFPLALANLPYFLERSDGSRELVELAQCEADFGPLEKDYPGCTKRAKEGISKYLARVSVSQG
ncbi:hypothetical protein GALMADRAFT_208027 [Galerina marginata CBS 339.88]|uniref:Uncharacterized protein n=1 Tax=Galerina marginata (strain CBS 339.88) TaxID=685588 RepID=A0A067TDG7_GALM3|nr:hypothetical protein GALMADRAFT_208027 [Galerina marginata CBS 339.88]